MEIIYTGLATSLVISLLWYIYFKNTQHQLSKENDALCSELKNLKADIDYQVGKRVNEKVEELNNKIIELKKESISIERESYEKGKQQAMASFVNEYTIQVNPYKKILKSNGNFSLFSNKKEKIEIGYQYQFFVKGIPAFEPSVVIIDTLEASKIKVNEQAINNLVKNAIDLKLGQLGGIAKVTEKVIAK